MNNGTLGSPYAAEDWGHFPEDEQDPNDVAEELFDRACERAPISYEDAPHGWESVEGGAQ